MALACFISQTDCLAAFLATFFASIFSRRAAASARSSARRAQIACASASEQRCLMRHQSGSAGEGCAVTARDLSGHRQLSVYRLLDPWPNPSSLMFSLTYNDRLAWRLCRSSRSQNSSNVQSEQAGEDFLDHRPPRERSPREVARPRRPYAFHQFRATIIFSAAAIALAGLAAPCTINLHPFAVDATDSAIATMAVD